MGAEISNAEQRKLFGGTIAPPSGYTLEFFWYLAVSPWADDLQS